MLKELKNAMRITINSHDALLANFLMAGANDLAIAGVVTTRPRKRSSGKNGCWTSRQPWIHQRGADFFYLNRRWANW